MKLLVDSCLGAKVVSALRNDGHDVLWAIELEKDPGDQALLERARQEGRILITQDKGFGELAIVYNHAHAGIIRLVGLSISEQVIACQKILQSQAEALGRGAIATAMRARLRIRYPSGTTE